MRRLRQTWLMHEIASLPTLPPAVRILLRPLPLLPLQLVLGRMVTHLGRHRPGIFTRLGTHADKVYLIDATDLPFAFRLRPQPERPVLEVCRREKAGTWQVRIAGPLAALLGMIHGSLDGDALFFSRDLYVEGDTEAVLALRNALDDAEIDLLSEVTAALGPAGPAVEGAMRRVLAEATRLSGFALLRAGS